MQQILRRTLSSTFAAVTIVMLTGAPLTAQRQSAPPEVRTMIDGVVAMLQGTSDSTLISFADKQLDPEYRQSFTEQELVDHLKSLRITAAEGDGSLTVRGAPGSVVIMMDQTGEVNFVVEWNDEFLVTKLEEQSSDD